MFCIITAQGSAHSSMVNRLDDVKISSSSDNSIAADISTSCELRSAQTSSKVEGQKAARGLKRSAECMSGHFA